MHISLTFTNVKVTGGGKKTQQDVMEVACVRSVSRMTKVRSRDHLQHSDHQRFLTSKGSMLGVVGVPILSFRHLQGIRKLATEQIQNHSSDHKSIVLLTNNKHSKGMLVSKVRLCSTRFLMPV